METLAADMEWMAWTGPTAAFFAGITRVSLRLANSNMPSSDSSRP